MYRFFKLKNQITAKIKNKQNQKLKNKLGSQEEKEEIIYKKNSVKSSSESEISNSLISHEKGSKKFCNFYCDYLAKREIFLCTFYNKHNDVTIFIRLPAFFTVIGFIFTINCLFLTENEIHKRYVYFKEHGKIDEFKYAFKNDLVRCIIVALICVIFKMICIKLVYFVVFKISSEIKDELFSYEQKNLNKSEIKKINSKKKKYLKQYKNKSIVFMIIILILLLIFAYLSTCYVGIFKNSSANILINFVISLIFSFIICAFLCFIISMIYIGGCLRIFNVLKIIY